MFDDILQTVNLKLYDLILAVDGTNN